MIRLHKKKNGYCVLQQLKCTGEEGNVVFPLYNEPILLIGRRGSSNNFECCSGLKFSNSDGKFTICNLIRVRASLLKKHSLQKKKKKRIIHNCPLTCSAVHPSRLLHSELKSFGDIGLKDICLPSNVMEEPSHLGSSSGNPEYIIYVHICGKISETC